MAKKNGGRQQPRPQQTGKSKRSRIVILILAVAIAVGILIIPLGAALSTHAEEASSSVVVKEFSSGKLADALLKAADGTDYNFIKKAAVLSGTMTAADYSALLNIPNLEYIELAGTETENGIIPENAIPSRNQLTYISLPKNTREIGKGAFAGNRKLEKISMPDTVTVIGDYAFDACESLASVPVTANVTYIGEGAFRDCKSISEFIIPAGITEIYPYTFSKCGFSEIIIGPDVQSIGDGVFADCNNLKDIYSYAESAPSIASADTFRNVSASIHVYSGSAASYKSWEGNNIKATEDLTGDYPVAAAPEKPAETYAPDTEKEAEPENNEAEAQTSAAQTTAAAAQTDAAETQPVSAQPAQSGGISVGIVIVIVIMAVIIAVLATVLVMTKKGGSKN